MPEPSAADSSPSASAGTETALNLPERPNTAPPKDPLPQMDAMPQMDTLPPFPQSRTPEPPAKKTRTLPKLPLWLVASAMFLIGLLIGVVVMRHRAQTQKIVVSVNGTTITRDQLFDQMQDTVGAQTVHKMIQNILQLQFAQKKGLAPTDADVEKAYDKMSQRPNFAQALAQSGILVGDFKYNLRVQLAETNVITQGITVTDADARKYYAAQSSPGNPNAQFYRPEEISLQAIATPTQALAEKALAELSSQTPFELAASTYSVDNSKSNGGLLAPLAFGRSPLHADPALEKRVFGMAVGSQIGPVFFAHQWWIFRCRDKAPAATVPYSQVQDQCLTGAKLVKGTALNSRRIQQEFTDFQHSSNLQAFWPQYQKVVAVR